MGTPWHPLLCPCVSPSRSVLPLALPQAVLGVFQKLIASKAHDHEGFYILNTLIESLDYQGTMAQVSGCRVQGGGWLCWAACR